FEHLQDCCWHALDGIPARSIVTFPGDQSFIPRNIVGGGYSPAAFQFTQVGRLGRGERPSQKNPGKTQHELYARMFPLHWLNIPLRSVQPLKRKLQCELNLTRVARRRQESKLRRPKGCCVDGI